MSNILRVLLAIERVILWLLLAACWANMLAVFVVANQIGGDVLGGKAVDGHFYVWVKHLKTFVEVSKGAYYFALWHMLSAFLSFLMAKAIWQILRPKA